MTPPTHTRGWYLQGSAPADGANALVWQDNIPLPPLAENDVLVKFYAWSVNYPELASTFIPFVLSCCSLANF